MYHLLSCLRKKFYRYIGISVTLGPFAGFLSLVWVTQFSQFEKGILCPFVSLIISTSNGSVFWVFYDYYCRCRLHILPTLYK